MFEYVKKDFVDKILYLAAHQAVITFTQYEQAMKMIQELPDEDVVEVVKCEKCIHYHDETCLKIYEDGDLAANAIHYRKPDDFCSYGETGRIK